MKDVLRKAKGALVSPSFNHMTITFSTPPPLLELPNLTALFIMVMRVVKFSIGGGKRLDRFLPKKQRAQRKLLNFKNWVNGKLSKIGHHFSNKGI